MTPGDRAKVIYDTEVYSLLEEVIGKVKKGTEVFVSMGPQQGRFAIEAEDGQMGWVAIEALEPLED
jgi:hypothetical protein